MAPTVPGNHDPTMAQAPPPQTSQGPITLPSNLIQGDMQNLQVSGLDQNQLLALLRNIPGVFNKLGDLGQGQGNLKEDAAQTLSNLSQAAPFQLYSTTASGGLPGINDPGPSSHPRGPPNLGQLSAVAMQAAPAARPEDQQQMQRDDSQATNNGAPISQGKSDGGSAPNTGAASSSTGGRSRGGRSATMGSDEWSRQRKDNHKEVERRRRGNINEGINELGRIVPNGSGEKAKGAILSRAVQYIHHLKENEARNIEKWTLEKLLMDQAMGDLQAQLEEVKRMWEEERLARQRLENELDVLRGIQGQQQKDAGSAPTAGEKRRTPDNAEGAAVADGTAEGDAEREGKRQRTE